MAILAAIHFPSQLDLAGRNLLAGALGGFIGLERELADHPAGLRTHISVALGAALFAVLSGYGFGAFQTGRNDTNFQVDVSRVASQIVVGVGFLGGGAILKDGAGVKGLTTAASLWVTAAIGAATGLGNAVLAAVTTGGLLAAMVLLRGPSRWLHRRAAKDRATVVIRLGPRQRPGPGGGPAVPARWHPAGQPEDRGWLPGHRVAGQVGQRQRPSGGNRRRRAGPAARRGRGEPGLTAVAEVKPR